MIDAAPVHVVNYGAGVQSETIRLLVLDGKLPRPDLFIFADTGFEPVAVYSVAARAQASLESIGIKFVTVTTGSIRDDHLRHAAGAPVNSGMRVPLNERSLRSMPLFTLGEGGALGMARRQCTERYKIKPIERYLRANYKGMRVVQWFGISTDEQERERVSLKRNWTYRYPLLYDVPMTRNECTAMLADRNVTVGKSACIPCPYRSRAAWRDIKADPVQWAAAVSFDRSIRHMSGARDQFYVHSSRKPLEDVDLEGDVGQQDLFPGYMRNECVGMCGV